VAGQYCLRLRDRIRHWQSLSQAIDNLFGRSILLANGIELHLLLVATASVRGRQIASSATRSVRLEFVRQDRPKQNPTLAVEPHHLELPVDAIIIRFG
jgi:hypothetical protein